MRRLLFYQCRSTLPQLPRSLNTKEFTSPHPRWRHSHTEGFLFSKIIAHMDKSYQRYPTFMNKTILFNHHYYGHLSGLSTSDETTENHSRHQLEVEVISKEFIKPAMPTPEHLRMHEMSLFEQFFPNVYDSFVYYYQNDKQNSALKKRQILKQSLSKTLTKLYPLAGKFKNNRLVDCNDDGVYYVEAKVNDHLLDFLKQPDNKSIHGLLPIHPNSVQLLSEKELAMVQVTEFGCGGIAIGTYTSHKFMDYASIDTFLKTWSSIARGASSEEISPSFTYSSIAPSNPTLSRDDARVMGFPLLANTKTATRRFRFSASSLAMLKNKLNSSRAMAVTAFIWERALAASKAQSKAIKVNCTPTSSSLTIVVNTRDRFSTPLPPYSIGNIFSVTPPIQCNGEEYLGADTIVQRLKDIITSQYTGDCLEQTKKYFLTNTEAALDMMHLRYADETVKHMLISSITNFGTYKTDFGWGNPIWMSPGNGDSDFKKANIVILMGTRCGNGIEAWVTLTEEDMKVFEQDPELLAMAALNASPLESVE